MNLLSDRLCVYAAKLILLLTTHVKCQQCSAIYCTHMRPDACRETTYAQALNCIVKCGLNEWCGRSTKEMLCVMVSVHHHVGRHSENIVLGMSTAGKL